MRAPENQPLTLDGKPHAFGEVISERSVELDNPASVTYRAGDSLTKINAELPFAQGGSYEPDYRPFVKWWVWSYPFCIERVAEWKLSYLCRFCTGFNVTVKAIREKATSADFTWVQVDNVQHLTWRAAISQAIVV